MPGSCVCATPDDVKAEDARITQRPDADAIARLVDERMTPLRYAGAEGSGMPTGSEQKRPTAAREAPQTATKWTWLSSLAPQQTSPARLQLTIHKSRRHYGGPLARAPRAGDGRHVPAGLLACGSGASPPPSRRMPAVASGATLAAYSCGGSRGFEVSTTSHRVPFSLSQPNAGRDETVTRNRSNRAYARLSTWNRRVRTVCVSMLTTMQRACLIADALHHCTGALCCRCRYAWTIAAPPRSARRRTRLGAWDCKEGVLQMGFTTLDALALAPAALLGLLGIWLGLARSSVAWPMRWLIPLFGACAAAALAALYLVANSGIAALLYLSGIVGRVAVAAAAFLATLALLLMFMRNLKARVMVWTSAGRISFVGRVLGALLGIGCGLLLAAIPYTLYESMRPDQDSDPPWLRESLVLPYFKSAADVVRTAASQYSRSPGRRP